MTCPIEPANQSEQRFGGQAFVPVHAINLVKRHGIRRARAMMHVDERKATQDPKTDPTKAWRFAMAGIAVHVLYQTAKWNILQDPTILEMVRKGNDPQRPVDDMYQQQSARVLTRTERILTTQFEHLTETQPKTTSEAVFRQAYGEYIRECRGLHQTPEELMNVGIEVLVQLPRFKLPGIFEDARQRRVGLSVNDVVDQLGRSFKPMDDFQAKLHNDDENILRGMTLNLDVVYNDRLAHTGFQKHAVVYTPFPAFSNEVLTSLDNNHDENPPLSQTYGCISRIPAFIIHPLTPDLPYSRASALVDANQLIRGLLRRI